MYQTFWWYIYSSWDIECDGLKVVILCHFSPLPSKNLKKHNFEKMKKISGDIILHVCTKNYNHMMFRSWDEAWDRHISFVILDHFLHFYSPNNSKNQNFVKMKKAPGDAIILHKYTKHQNHMMYVSWDMECNRQNCSSFWAIFCPFIPLTTWKTNILKKWKIPLEILSFYTFTINENHMMYSSWDIRWDRENFLSFWAIFCHYLPNNPENQNFGKMKKHLEILSFQTCVL